MQVLTLGGPDVRALLPMQTCMQLMEDALRALARDQALLPSRTIMSVPNRHGAALLTMPECLAAVPLDPQDGQPLRYQQLSDRVVIYSVCPVARKSGSTERYDPNEPSPPGVGVAVHLFDMGHRRQPPAEMLAPPVPQGDQ